VDGATDGDDAVKKISSGSLLKRPLVVDWNNGRVGKDDFFHPELQLGH